LCFVVPTLIASRMSVFKGEIEGEIKEVKEKSKYSAIMFYLGLGSILFVPIFKTVTHLPPYVGMMLSLAIVAAVAEYLSNFKFSVAGALQDDKTGHHSPIHKSLSKIEMPSLLFFLGILMAVAALESLGMLFDFAGILEKSVPMVGTESATRISDLVVVLLGVGSAVIDNVPLVAASIGMFDLPLNEPAWHFIAYAAGTGGSILIIGSAAGVVAMGMEKIDFFWYLKKIGGLAFLGFVAGAIGFIVLRGLIH